MGHHLKRKNNVVYGERDDFYWAALDNVECGDLFIFLQMAWSMDRREFGPVVSVSSVQLPADHRWLVSAALESLLDMWTFRPRYCAGSHFLVLARMVVCHLATEIVKNVFRFLPTSKTRHPRDQWSTCLSCAVPDSISGLSLLGSN